MAKPEKQELDRQKKIKKWIYIFGLSIILLVLAINLISNWVGQTRDTEVIYNKIEPKTEMKEQSKGIGFDGLSLTSIIITILIGFTIYNLLSEKRSMTLSIIMVLVSITIFMFIFKPMLNIATTTKENPANYSIGTLQEAMQKENLTTGIGNFVMVMAILGGVVALILGLLFAVKRMTLE